MKGNDRGDQSGSSRPDSSGPASSNSSELTNAPATNHPTVCGLPRLEPEEAAKLVRDGALVAFSGFTPAGSAKAVPRALAARARRLHDRGKPFKIRVLTGASTGPSLDDALAEADAISWRAPYQSSRPLRERINDGRVAFVDMHLSHVPQSALFGFFGKIDLAIVEASHVTEDGRIYLTTSIGASPTFLQTAEKVIIELNRRQSPRISEMADILIPKPPPFRPAIDLDHPLQRVGKSFVRIDPDKIAGVVLTDEDDELTDLGPADETCLTIARHVVNFLQEELASGRIPPDFLPLQSGVGKISNAVLKGIGENPAIPDFLMYSEVFQSAAFDLMQSGRLRGASTCALTLAPHQMAELTSEIDYYQPRLILRPQEISNNPAVVRQLGVIALNTALEVDLFGNVNSTHVCGRDIINGIGGSGDFARNSYLSIFVCPSFAKRGKISTVVPMCPHVDHSEHSVHVIATEQGIADLRGLAPAERAEMIIENCAHPAYRDYLRRYARTSGEGHIRHDFSRVFELHERLQRDGCMLPENDVNFSAA
ncbi:MAG: succinate CoA transferase [Planctomycetales bacterium]|nr:succinate CoA transferase [Planctomycetales bacterium]